MRQHPAGIAPVQSGIGRVGDAGAVDQFERDFVVPVEADTVGMDRAAIDLCIPPRPAGKAVDADDLD